MPPREDDPRFRRPAPEREETLELEPDDGSGSDPVSDDDLVEELDDGPVTHARIAVQGYAAPQISMPSSPPLPPRNPAFAGSTTLDLTGSRTDTRTWTLRAEAFRDQIDRARAPEQRARLYRELAGMLEGRLDDPGQAFDVLLAAFGEAPDDDETASSLERLAHQTGRLGELVQFANAALAEVEANGDAQRFVALSLRLAKWYGEDVDHPEWALPFLERAQAAAPRDVRPLRILARIRRRAGEVDRAGATLVSALELASNDQERKEIHAEIGELLWKHKGDVEQAIASYRRALEIDPGWPAALDALGAIYGDRGESAAVAELLEQKLVRVNDGPERHAARVRLASLYAGPLGKPERAARLLEEVMRVDPGHATAFRELAALHRASGDARGLRAALERRLEAAATAREQLELATELAGLLEITFQEPDLALYRLEQALAIAPDDEPTLESLARLYARQHRHADAAAMLEHHASIAREPKQRAKLYAAWARTLERDLGDRARALEAWTAAAELDAELPEAAAALARLEVRAGDPAAAMERLRRAAQGASDPSQRASAYHALGLALEESHDVAAAREAHLTAIDRDPDHPGALGALRRLALAEGDERGALRWLERELALTKKPHLRAQLLAKLGTIRADVLGDMAGARAAWQEAVASDPDVDEALRRLAEAHVAAGSFSDAEPMLARLRTRAASADDARRIAALHGRALLGLGRDAAAARALDEAQQLAPDDPEVLDALAEASWLRQDWAAALEAHQRLLATLKDGARRVEVLHRLAVAQRALGMTRAAIATLDRALAATPDHRPSLEALAAIYEEQQDWQGYVDAERQLADTAVVPEDRLAALDAIARAWWQQVGDAGQALAALDEALGERPRDLARLHKVLEIAQAKQDWQRVLDVLGRIVGIEENRARRAKYVLTMGQVLRDVTRDAEQALACFERALDDDPTELRAFEAIDRLLTSMHDWRRLARAYRKMLHRVSEGARRGTDVEHHLWSALGLICRDRLDDQPAAVEAFRMAAKLRPEDARTRRILADLHERSGHTEEAAAELQEAIAREPRRAEPYRQLYRLYRREGAFDRAWCVAAALSFLQQADEEQTHLLQHFAFEVPLDPSRPLDLTGFAALFPREHDLMLGKLLELLSPALRAARLLRLSAEGRSVELPAASLHDPATSPLPIVQDLAVAAAVLGLPLPRPSARPDVAGGLSPLPVDPPASLIGADALAIASPHERRFHAARHVARYRPELFVTTLVGAPAELKALSLSALQLSQVDVSIPEDIARVAAETSRELARYLQPVQREALRKVMKRFVERGGQADVKSFWKTVDRTASRVGLLLSGDVAAAARACAAEPLGPFDPSAAERIEDLLAWSVSDAHFRLREAIGILVTG